MASADSTAPTPTSVYKYFDSIGLLLYVTPSPWVA